MAEPVAEVGNNLDAFYDDHSHLDYNPQDHEHFDEEDIPQPPSLRDEIRHRKEKEKQDDEAQFTFRPQVNAYKKGHPLANDAVKENRFDKLYGDALKRHLTSQVKVSEDPSKRDKDLTFKPKISTLGAKQSRSSSRERLGISRSNSRSRDASHSRDASQERGDSRDRSGLASDSEDTTNNNRTGRSRSNSNTGLNRSRGVSKILEEQQAMMTFRPVISKRAKSIERQRQQEDQNIVERLYQKEKQVKEKMDQKKSDIEQLRMQECTFAPSVVTKPKPFSGQSNLEVTERLRRFEEMKKKKLEEALRKREEEEAEKLTFKPQISRRAQSPSASVSLSQDFVNLSLEERLMTPTKRRNSRAEEEASRELTFKPKLVAKRAPSPSAAAASSEYKTPHERLYVEGSIHKREIEHKREQIRTSLDRELTFSPELATKGHGQRQRDVSPDSHLFERLNAYVKGEPDKIEKLRRDREAELTFQPQLTKRTLEIAVRSPDSEMTIYERQKAEQDRMQIELDMRRQQQEEEKMKALTFQPQVPESSKELARRRSQANIDAGGDCASVFSMSVHSRLASMYTISSASQSLAGMNDNATIMTENTKPEEPLHPRNSLVLPEEKVSQLVRRLSMHKKVEEAPSEVRVKVMSPEKYEEAVQRLSMQKTMSFTLKTDAAQLEAVQPKLIKEPPKVTTEQMNEILERLQSPTVSAAVSAETPRESPLGNNPLLRTASGRSFVMSTSQFNLLMSTAAAGAAAVHGSPSPTRRHTFASPPKASFFGTPLTAIPAAENEEGHEDEHDEDSDEDDDRKGVSEVKMPDHSQATTANPYARGTRRIDSLADLEVEMVEEEGSDEEEEEEERRRQAAKNSANKKKAAPVSASKKTPTTASKASPRKSVTSSTPTAASPVKKPVPVATPVTVRGAATTTPGSNGSRSTTPTSARRHSAPTPAAATSPVRPTSAGRRPAPSATATAAVATATTPTVLNRATPKSSLPTATSGTGEFVDEFEKKLQMTMAMLKPLDAMPPAPPAAQPAAPAVAQPVAQRVMQPVVESLPVPPVVPSNTSVAGLFPLPESQPTVQPVSTPAAPTAVIEEVNEPAPEPEVVVSETVVVEAERPVSPVVEVPAATAESAPQQEEVAVAPPTDETPNTPRESTAIDDAVETTPAHHPVDEVAATPDTPLNGSSANVLTSVDSAWTMGTSADEGDEEDDGEEVDMQASSLSLRSSTGGGSDKKKKKKKKKKGSKK